MTKFNSIDNFYRPSTLGFERIFNDVEKMIENLGKPVQPTYPPHNIVKVDSNRYVVELAIAGFTKKDVEITVDNGNLVIKGSRIEPDSTIEYLYRGIGTRSFTKTIKLADTIEVRGAEYKDGILRIGLENVVPDDKKTRKIEIENTLGFSEKQLLQE